MPKTLTIQRFLHVPKHFNGDFNSLQPRELFLGEANVGELIHMHCLGQATITVDLSGIVPTSLEEARLDLHRRIMQDTARLSQNKEELAALDLAIQEMRNAQT